MLLPSDFFLAAADRAAPALRRAGLSPPAAAGGSLVSSIWRLFRVRRVSDLDGRGGLALVDGGALPTLFWRLISVDAMLAFGPRRPLSREAPFCTMVTAAWEIGMETRPAPASRPTYSYSLAAAAVAGCCASNCIRANWRRDASLMSRVRKFQICWAGSECMCTYDY